MRDTKGITLIALIVTIIVLLILAGVTIVVLFGDHSILETLEKASLQTKLAEVEEKANIAYADLNTKKYEEGNPSKIITMEQIKHELEKQKYHIKQIQLSENAVTEIELEPKTIKMSAQETKTIQVIFQGNNEQLAYYVQVEKKYYQISIKSGHIIVDKTNGKTEEELGKSDSNVSLEANSNNDIVEIIGKTEDSIEIKAGDTVGNVQITVTYGNLEPKNCNVIVAVQPIEGTTPTNTPIKNGYGKIDILWLDENNNIIEEPKAPVLGEAGNKMKAIKWEGVEEKPADETNKDYNWYQYIGREDTEDNNNSHWANAKTENGSYFVWIPRYAYRITYYRSQTDVTEVGYYDGYGMWDAKTGAISYALEPGIETVENEQGDKYIVHPVFGTTKTDETSKKQNIELGGWDKNLTGFWFAKFEMSGEDAETLKSAPGVQSQRNKKIGEFYTEARTATYGQIGNLDSFDNQTSFMNSHMIKNSEWRSSSILNT